MFGDFIDCSTDRPGTPLDLEGLFGLILGFTIKPTKDG